MTWKDYATLVALALLTLGGFGGCIALVVSGLEEGAEIEARCRAHGEEPMQMYKGPTLCVKPDGTLVRR